MSGSVLKNRYPRLKVKMGRELLKVQHLWADPILKDINFTLHRGEIIGITGLAGSGRSYLAHTLFGVHKTEQGAIAMNGKGVSIQSPVDAIQHGIALIPEDRISDSLVSCPGCFRQCLPQLSEAVFPLCVSEHNIFKPGGFGLYP